MNPYKQNEKPKTKNTTVVPYLLEGYLVIALHPQWMKLFNGIPTFVVEISEDKKTAHNFHGGD